MAEIVPDAVTDMWGKWSIRGLVISSLALQATLVLLSPNRKRTHMIPFQIIIWSAYLLANWSADYAVGQISESSGEGPEPNKSPKTNDLLAFWAMFLLLHLGGPDTVTALALEDNELWLRSLFGLASQLIATLYVFFLSVPTSLLVPTSLMLVAGVIKYLERIRAMHGASLQRFKDSMLWEPEPGIDYARFMEEYKTRKVLKERSQLVRVPELNRRQKIEEVRESGSEKDQCMTHLEVVQHAYKYFNIYKGLLVDFIYSSQQWMESKQFFQGLSAEDALRILEVELSFMYGTLYTKGDILHTWLGASFRCIALGCLFTSLYLFKTLRKDGYDGFDVGLTYALIIGGIALDFISIIIFCVSDWTFARLKKPKKELNTSWFLNWLLGFRKLKWKKCECYHYRKEQFCHSVLDRLFIFRRWSEYIYSYSLISSTLKIKPKRIHQSKGYIHRTFDAIIGGILCIGCCAVFLIFKVVVSVLKSRKKIDRWFLHLYIDHPVLYYVLYPVRLVLIRFWFGIPLMNYLLEFFGITHELNVMRYTSGERLIRELWEFVFEEVARRSVFVVGMEERASQVYSARGDWILNAMKAEIDNEKLLPYVTDLEYDQSILVWHIATELLHQTYVSREDRNATSKELSKTLSEYMMYLLIAQPSLMSTVAGIDKVRFRDATAEIKNLRNAINKFQKKLSKRLGNAKTACEAILSLVEDSWPRNETAREYGGSKSVLLRASMLANDLKNIEHKVSSAKMWEVMSKVWVEMLCYAATHCDSKQHAAQLNRGGELINFVWLLMAHFGLGEQFRTTKEDSRAKLILDKTTTSCLV